MRAVVGNCLAIVFTILPACRPAGRPPDVVEWLAAMGGRRVFEGRLAGTPYTPYDPQPAHTLSANVAALSVLSRAQQIAGIRHSVQAARVLAAGEIAAGRPDVAIALLSEAEGFGEDTTALNVDLAAAYLAAAATTDAPGLPLARAMDAAVQATATSAAPAAWFNLALALERFHLTPEALQAWDRVLATERDDGWRQEAARRRAALAAPPAASVRAANPEAAGLSGGQNDDFATIDVEAGRRAFETDLLPAWARAYRDGQHDEAERTRRRAAQIASAVSRECGDRLPTNAMQAIASAAPAQRLRLAAGHQAYAEALARFEANDREAALRLLDTAIADFTAGGSGFAEAARAQRAIVLYGMRAFERARQEGQTALQRATPRGFLVVRADAEWVDGVTASERGDLEAALDVFRRAIDDYTSAKEMDRAIRAVNTAADTLRIMGHDALGWTFLGRALSDLERVRTPRGRQVILLNASLYAAAAGLNHAARVFQDASLRVASERHAENAIVEAHMRRARLYLAVADVKAAGLELEIAEGRLARVKSEASREYLRAWLDAVRGEWLLANRDPLAAARLDAAIGAFGRLEPAEVPRLYLLRGRAALPQGVADAERAFRAGIDVLQRRLLQLNERAHRVSYLDEGWELFDELIDLRASTDGDSNEAFALAELARVRAAGDVGSAGVSPLRSPGELSAVVPRDGAVLYYTSLRGRLLLWLVGRDEQTLVTIPAGTDELSRRVTIYRRLLEARRAGALARQSAEELYRILIDPVASRLAGVKRLVIIPDGVLHAIPFSGLLDPHTSRFVGDTFAVSTMPSATELAALARRRSERPAPAAHRALVVGAAAGAPERGLAALPEVAGELAALQTVYPGATVLSGEDVDASRWRAALPDHDVVHFAGHAVVNTQFPDLSELVLGRHAGAASAIVTAGEIARWPLRGVRLITLSACQTAYGALYRGGGLSSLARWFVAAGAETVVGTMWSVQDDIAGPLTVRFHESYAASGQPAEALQASQRSLVQAKVDPMLAWSAFIVIGGFD